MAGNNAIQILRANSATIANSSETLLDGQLLYNTDKNYLTCGGGGNNKPVNSLPIVCQELAYYQGDADTISANTGLVHRIGPNKLVNKLEIYSNSSISLTGTNVNISANNNNGNISITATLANSLVNIRGDALTLGTGVYAAFTANSNSVGIGTSLYPVNVEGYPLNLKSLKDINMQASGNINLNTNTFNVYADSNVNIRFSVSATGFNMVAYNSANYLRFTGASTNIVSTSMNLISYDTTRINTTNSLSLYSFGSLQINGSNTSIIGRSNLSLQKMSYIYSFPNYSGTVALRSDIGEVIYSNSGRVLPNTSTSNANAFSLISSSNIYMYDQVLIKFKCSNRPNSSSLSSYFETSVIADRMGYLDDWGSFSATPTFITCYYGNFSIFRSHCHIQFSYTNGQILANQYQSSSSSSYSCYGMTFYANGNVATFDASNRANFWKVGITDIIGITKNANYLNS